MKIAFIVPYRFVPAKNGGHKAAYGFASFLAKKVDLVCLSAYENDPTEDFTLVACFKDVFTKYINPMVALKLGSFIRKEQVQYVIFHQPFMVLLLWPFLKLYGISSAIFIQNVEFQRFKSLNKWWWPGMYLFEWLTFRLVDHLYFIAPTDVEAAKLSLHISGRKCTALNYGTNLKKMPEDRNEAKSKVIQKHGFDSNDKLLLFFGPQSYQPNLEAVLFIKNELYPVLNFPNQVLICGGGLPAQYQKQLDELSNIHYLGFVEDIESYIKAADLMLNPIKTGGGVKTKIIEAIALGTTVISFESGAKGVDLEATEGKLSIVQDENVIEFSKAMYATLAKENFIPTSPMFYEYFHWEGIVKKVLPAIL